ncbi:phosphoglycerate dehydrogenase [Luteitalea sp.]|jgi:D-3-phosphoglycerate dehydrogenase|uniref:phosphoglycerate dehydrogenase n=1 Tax=Luteitalea sp. TaxID=2004800 RepID=UPI0037C75A3C
MAVAPASSPVSFDKSLIKVVLLENVHQSAVEAFRADGYSNIHQHGRALEGAALREAIADAHVLGIRSRTQLTAEVLAAAPKLITVGAFCIGTNQIDLAAAETLGVPVFNAPFSNTRSVAELVIAEVVLLLRDVPRRNASAHRGGWDKSPSGAHEVRGKTLGIVGYGHIGTQVGLLAEALGMRVLFYDVVAKLALGNAQAVRSMDALLASADVVTLHVPETPQTQGLVGAAQLRQMRPGAHLINASRGTVVDIEALAEALRSGHLGGAALDVFPHEPESNTEQFESPLRGLDNVILTPHIGGSTAEAQEAIGVEVAEKLLTYSNNGSTLSAVNFPEVALPGHPGKHRLLHIHHNKPGMLSRVNDVFADARMNVAAQYLLTSARIGYVVIDVDADPNADTPAVRRELAALDGTIRARLLY